MCISVIPLCLGWSLLEAMACGCCIVGSQGMPVEEAIEHNVEGRLVPMDQPDVLAKEVLQLLASPTACPLWCSGTATCPAL